MNIKRTLRFFDKFEDRIRNRLSRYPVVYAFVGAVGIVLFWRGVWGIADKVPLLSNPYMSLLVSVFLLLAIGLFVSFFIGDSIIISGLRGEKKLVDKTRDEIVTEGKEIAILKEEMEKVEAEVHEVRNQVIAMSRKEDL